MREVAGSVFFYLFYVFSPIYDVYGLKTEIYSSSNLSIMRRGLFSAMETEKTAWEKFFYVVVARKTMKLYWKAEREREKESY